MANPYLPSWEYIPDGEPRVFGDRVYVYGSHDCVDCERFCDYKLKVWSASVHDLSHWTCHGDIFRSKAKEGKTTDTPWTEHELYAPDVVEKDGKYYLYAYIVDAKGCVAVSDRPEGPFMMLSQYQYNIPDHYDNGTFIDPGVLVDDDGRVYVYCGFLGSYMCELNGDNMYEVVDGSYQTDIIPVTETEDGFFEACSPRKVGDTYYLIYSPKIGSRLAYATSDSPTGPFTYRGYIVDNGADYPGGNNHGSICQINGQWYIFYHRMTNGSIMSRRGCVERIEILEDGTIPTVEMTSLGFEESLNPYEATAADTVCVLKNVQIKTVQLEKNVESTDQHLCNEQEADTTEQPSEAEPKVDTESKEEKIEADEPAAFITELDPFTRIITNITDGCVMGWKYFDFGDDFTGDEMTFMAKVHPRGCHGKLHICIDDEQTEIGVAEFERDSTTLRTKVQNITGRHAVYLIAQSEYNGWSACYFERRQLFDLEAFQFCK